jgi:hypothetical protein
MKTRVSLAEGNGNRSSLCQTWSLGIGLAWGNIALACLKIKRCLDWTFKHALGTQALRYGKPLTVIGALIGVSV